VTPVRKLTRPVKLSELKADTFFTDFHLVRMSRLSVMPVTDDQWERIEAMSKT
jgi:predicted RNA-binding protein with PUA-like domain